MPFPILFYILGSALIGGAIGVTLATFFDDIKSWLQNSFKYIVTEAKIIIDKILVNGKKILRIKATTQKKETIEQTIENVDINSLPPEIREQIKLGNSYKETLFLNN